MSQQQPDGQPQEHEAAQTSGIQGAEGHLKRYQVLAWITGVFLLILVAEMILKYIVRVGPEIMSYIEWIPFAHGWIYVVYLVTVIMLWQRMGWSIGTLVLMVFGGVVPVMSFIVEKKITVRARAEMAAQ